MRDGVGDLVMERVAGERGVVGLDVQPVFVLEPVPDEEAVDRRRVVVVLVLGRLHGLGLDQQRAFEPDPVLVLGDEVEEPGELIALALEVRVEQRVVALAAAPQDVVRAAEPMGDLEHVLDLRRGVGKDLGIRVRRCAGLVARVGEQVGRAPEQPGLDSLLVAERVIGQCVEVVAELGEGAAFRGNVPIVEAVIRDAELLDELERHGHLLARGRHRFGGRIEPGPVKCPDPEHVAAIPGKGVPEAHADPEVVLHALSEDKPIGFVDLECKRIWRVEATERDRARHLREEIVTHVRPSVTSPTVCTRVDESARGASEDPRLVAHAGRAGWHAATRQPALMRTCASVDAGPMDEITILQAEVLKTLANPRRLEILHRLAGGPLEVGRLADGLGLSQPNVSQHLAVLRTAGVVDAERNGREVRYRLSDPDVMRACGIMRGVLERRLTRLANLSAAASDSLATAASLGDQR